MQQKARSMPGFFVGIFQIKRMFLSLKSMLSIYQQGQTR